MKNFIRTLTRTRESSPDNPLTAHSGYVPTKVVVSLDDRPQPEREDRTAYWKARREAAKSKLAELETHLEEMEEVKAELKALKARLCACSPCTSEHNAFKTLSVKAVCRGQF